MQFFRGSENDPGNHLESDGRFSDRPQTGELSVVLDGSGNPVLIIQTIEVFVLPFNEVSDQFAFDEGEGDRSLAYWRKAHENYFRRNDFKDRAFDERVPVVCERSKLCFLGQPAPFSF